MSGSHSEFLSKYTLHKQTSGVAFQQCWTNVPAMKRAVPLERPQWQQPDTADTASLRAGARPGPPWVSHQQLVTQEGRRPLCSILPGYRLSATGNTHRGNRHPSGRHGKTQVRGIFHLALVHFGCCACHETKLQNSASFFQLYMLSCVRKAVSFTWWG